MRNKVWLAFVGGLWLATILDSIGETVNGTVSWGDAIFLAVAVAGTIHIAYQAGKEAGTRRQVVIPPPIIRLNLFEKEEKDERSKTKTKKKSVSS